MNKNLKGLRALSATDDSGIVALMNEEGTVVAHLFSDISSVYWMNAKYNADTIVNAVHAYQMLDPLFGLLYALHVAWTWFRYTLGFGCGYACEVVEPYGFVPEVGCPIHD